ncbi:GTP cyclohydrolase II [Chachezhania antarctica]|uniref:GTP cyclohydrolase II n=1 Tax=Chachezhania antarctica TaxID=2340860 RepID=UPI000EAD347C|nr:GTP cyclohydrolase II [Chachezhania antarctica]
MSNSDTGPAEAARTLAPDAAEVLARARGDLRMGMPIVINRAGRAVLVAAAETLTPGRLDLFRALSGAVALAITARRAETLKARAYDGDLARIQLPADADFAWIRSVADPAGDLTTPMKGPLLSLREGSADLHRTAIQIAKSAQLLPAAIVAPLEPAAAALVPQTITRVDQDDAVRLTLGPLNLEPVVHARLPLAVSEAGRLHVFRPADGGEEHYAVEIGRPDRDQPVLARVHSACFTGDLLGSLKCDCGPQLRGAMAQMGSEGNGVLLYLNQEGRGIGLANKMRAYALQDQGFDTVEANHRLGFEDDERDFRIGAELLRKLGFSQARLLTNNPAKVAMLEKEGITVTERVPLIAGHTEHNRAYLETKAAKSGHLF